MQNTHQTALFIFRRDLRLEDNSGLVYALQSSKSVIPAFIFTPEQIDDNPYRSDHCLKFMLESLIELDSQLREKKSRLYIFKGHPEEVVAQLSSQIDAVIVNRDYTPYSLQRDHKIEMICKLHQISFYSFEDALLHAPENTLKKDGSPYIIFTPYFRNALKLEVRSPTQIEAQHYFQGTITCAKPASYLVKALTQLPSSNGLKGGRSEALNILKRIHSFKNYERLRDFPAEDFSTHLSPYLKFTLCSPREVYAAIRHDLGTHHALLRSLYWRDFFTSIAYFFPHVFTGSFHKKFDHLTWSDDPKAFEKWCQGFTGFPIVDAGMREMNRTGFMHNRVRMIAASLLVKDLHLNWRWGEKYFAQTLIDYDPAVNNGNWQWVASSGCDAQPYFRIFNPWNQQKKFDPECLYIKRWIPELAGIPAKVIHHWHEEVASLKCDYPAPLVNHQEEAPKALAAYKTVSGYKFDEEIQRDS